MKLIDFRAMRSRLRPLAQRPKRVLVINGHPDPRPERFCAALSSAYADAAQSAGCDVRRLDIGSSALPFDHAAGGTDQTVIGEISGMLERIWWAHRLFVVYPMWFEGPPPRLSYLLNALARRRKWVDGPDPAVGPGRDDRLARVVVTSSLPALLYRETFPVEEKPMNSHSISLPGLRIEHATLIGSVDSISAEDRLRWLDKMSSLGRSDCGDIRAAGVRRRGRPT
jgi:putative NADPH-quinone reductase